MSGPPPKRRAVLAGRDVLGKLLRGEKRAERQSGSDRLGDTDHVRLHAEVLESEEPASAAEAALNLVVDQSGLMLISHGAAGLKEFRTRLLNAALTLNRLQHNRANLLVHRIA